MHTVKRTNTNWMNPELLKLFSEEVSKSPDNLKRAFGNVAIKANVSSHAVTQAWYKTVKPVLETQFTVGNNSVSFPNTKNVPRKAENNVMIHETVVSNQVFEGMRVKTVRQYYTA